MGLFDLDEEDERDEALMEIVSHIKELYADLINGDPDTLAKGSTAYEDDYKKILRGLEEHYDPGGFGFQCPEFLKELSEEVQPTGMVIPTRHTVIKRIEMGLKTISRKLDIDLPEKKLESREDIIRPSSVTVNTNQFLNNEINITMDIKIQVDQAITDFEKEINKSNPNPSTLKTLFDIIKKGSGYGIIKIIELLLKKYCGL